MVDPDGVVYYNYNMEMYEGFFKLKYMSNLDTDDWDTEDGMRTLYDFLRRNRDDNNSAYLAGWDEVWNILSSLRDAMEKKHVRISSLAYKVSKVFGSLLENEDIVKKLAESREVNEKMIDMIKVFNDHEETKKADVIPMTMFAKK